MSEIKKPEIGKVYRSLSKLRPHTITLLHIYTDNDGQRRVINFFNEEQEVADLGIGALDCYEEIQK